MTRRVSMTCPDIGYSMPRKKFDSGKIRVLILNVYAACPEPDTSPYFRFSQEYGFVSTNIGIMTQLISHSGSLIVLTQARGTFCSNCKTSKTLWSWEVIKQIILRLIAIDSQIFDLVPCIG